MSPSTEIPNSKTRLLEASFDLIWSGGFRASGVDEICRQADVRKGSFYHHFASKTELAIAAVEHDWEQLRRTLYLPIFEGPERGLARFRALLVASDDYQRAVHANCGRVRGCAYGNLGQEMAGQDDGLRGVVALIFDALLDWFERTLEEALELGEIEAGGELRVRAQSMLALIQGAFLLAKVSNDPGAFRSLAEGILLLAAGTRSV